MLLLVLLAVAASPIVGFERLQRRFGLEQGLPFSEVYALAQDAGGFIWIATSGGLFRYDGVEMRPWPQGTSRPVVKRVAAGPRGEVVACDLHGRLLEVDGRDLRAVPAPDEIASIRFDCPVFDERGNLWAAGGGRLWKRPPGGGWRAVPPERMAGEAPLCQWAAAGGGILVTTAAGLWRIGPEEDASRLVRRAGIVCARAARDASIVVVLDDGTVVRYEGDEGREQFRLGMRPIDLMVRDESLWVSYDNALVHHLPGQAPEILGATQGIPTGGTFLVDREGSLWVGTFRGLLQFPSPETVAWGSDDGLNEGPRRLALGTEGIWVDTWSGLYLMRRTAGGFRPERVPGSTTGAICTEPDGTLWAAGQGRLLARRGGRFIERPLPGLNEVSSCAPAAGDSVWLTTNLGLFMAHDEGAAKVSVSRRPGPPITGPPSYRAHAMEDAAGRLWFAAGDEVCRTDARALAAGRSPPWSCDRVAGAGRILFLWETPSRNIWAGTLEAGVMRLRPGGGWEPVPGARALPGQAVRALRPSQSGGVWIVSYGTVLRVIERPGSPEGWEIVERPSPWHGLMISDAEDILEESGGDLWVTTLAGLVHVPADVRRSAMPVPRVELIDILLDGVGLSLDRPLRLPYQNNRIELRYAGLSYRDPGLLRYQVRLGPERPWIDASGRPSFRFIDLPPGTYHAEVRASLDGGRWSPAAADLSFTVLPPFWRTWWFGGLVLAALAGTVVSAFRYRLAQFVRLERTRTRIAADLHDDIGASLSRIALQSELLRRRASIRPEEGDRLLREIGESARSLVDSMSDIVWSIDPRRDDFASVIARLRQFALDLLEPRGIGLEFRTPEGAERVKLGPEPRRHLYLILKEAVNNIARHAECRRASIVLSVDGDRLHAEVRDDGRGFEGQEMQPAGMARRGGHGLENMAYRAGQIGGRLEVRSVPGGGTVLSLTLPIRRIEA